MTVWHIWVYGGVLMLCILLVYGLLKALMK